MKTRTSAKGFGRKIRAVIVRAWGWQPLTISGAAVLGISLYLWKHLSHANVDYVIHGAGLTGVALVGTATVFSVFTAVILAYRARSLTVELPPEFETGSEQVTAYELTNLQWLPVVELKVSITEPKGMVNHFKRDGLRLKEYISTVRRGTYNHVSRNFVVGDLFGFTSIRFTRRSEVNFRVLPALGRGTLSMAMRMISGEGISHPEGEPVGDRVEMRRYAPGDPLRLVLWKTFARTRTLLVRTEERAIAPNPSTVGYLVAGEGDEAAASTARLFVEEEVLGDDFVFGADGSNFNADTKKDVLDQILRSVDHQERGGADLAGFLRRQDQRRLGQCVIFAPPVQGPWLSHVLQLVQTLPSRPKVVIAVDGALQAPQRGRLARFMTMQKRQEMAHIRDLPNLYDTLAKHGCEVVIVHKASGNLISVQQLNTWRETA